MKHFNLLVVIALLFFSCNRSENQKTKSETLTVKNVDNVSVAGKETINTAVDTVFDFDNCEIGKLPAGWSQGFTGRGSGTEWKVVDYKENKVMAQLSSDNPNYHFNVVVYDGFELKNMEMSVKFRAFSGKMDQGGGLVWRYTDKDNYYVVRANPLENNVVLYKVVNGKRTDLPVLGKGRTYGVDVKEIGIKWNTLKVAVNDNLFTVYLNDDELFKVKDSTFENAGKTGLWTKADAVTYFDDFAVSGK